MVANWWNLIDENRHRHCYHEAWTREEITSTWQTKSLANTHLATSFEMSILAFVFHSVISFLDFFGLYTLIASGIIEDRTMYFLFFTLWTEVLHGIAYAVSAIADVNRSPKLQRASSILFTLAFSAAFVTTIIFWGLFIFATDLIVPPGMQYGHSDGESVTDLGDMSRHG